MRVVKHAKAVLEENGRPMSTLEIHSKMKSKLTHTPRPAAVAKTLSHASGVRRVGYSVPAMWVLES